MPKVWIYVLAAYVAIGWIYGAIYAWDRWPMSVMEAFVEGLSWPERLWVLIFLGPRPG